MRPCLTLVIKSICISVTIICNACANELHKGEQLLSEEDSALGFFMRKS